MGNEQEQPEEFVNSFRLHQELIPIRDRLAKVEVGQQYMERELGKLHDDIRTSHRDIIETITKQNNMLLDHIKDDNVRWTDFLRIFARFRYTLYGVVMTIGVLWLVAKDIGLLSLMFK